MIFQNSNPPNADSLEVSLFGFGVGEGLAIHVGGGDWVLVDSCRSTRTDIPIHLAYLDALGVDAKTAVKLIVATHWHDDHVSGLSHLVERCVGAKLAFSQALTQSEFRSMMSLYSRPDDFVLGAESSGVQEMSKSLEILLRRKIAASNYAAPISAQADQLLFKNGFCEVWAISPSPESINEATQDMAKLWTSIKNQAAGAMKPRPARSNVVRPRQNHNAVVLWIKWGNERVLLGADIEEHGNSLTGWQGVLACQIFPDMPARIYKVAHHGSPNGDYAGKWDKLVSSPDPIAMLTSYTSCVTPRPDASDIARLLQRTNELYATSLPNRTLKKYPSAVERTMSSVVKRRTSRGRDAGHIQVRLDVSGSPNVVMSGKAAKVKAAS